MQSAKGLLRLILATMAAWLPAAALAADLAVDFAKPAGQVRPLNGGNGGPLNYGETIDLTEYHKALAIPYTRLHDCGWPCGNVVDIHAIFPDLKADPARAESYDFRRTDDYIAAIVKRSLRIGARSRVGPQDPPYMRGPRRVSALHPRGKGGATMRIGLVAGAAAMSVLVLVAGGAARPRAQIGAYYFDGWAGKSDQAGKAEWAKDAPTHLTKRMLDEFSDREPVWGWRDDSPQVMERQIDLAADGGLAFFAFCWYWHESEKDIRQDPKHTGLELFLKAKNNTRLKFCLLVANHAGFEIRGTDAWKRAADLWMPYLAHKQHLTVGGRPLVIIFSPGGGDKAGFECLQAAARKAGLPGVAIAACGTAPAGMGYTHTTHYNIVPGWEKGLEAHKYQELVDAHKRAWKGTREQPYIPCLSAGWDRRPWEAAGGLGMDKACWYYPDRTPEQFAALVRDAVEWIDKHPDETTAERIAVVYAWNEFGEGGYVAPTKGDPDGKYLKALRSAVMP